MKAGYLKDLLGQTIPKANTLVMRVWAKLGVFEPRAVLFHHMLDVVRISSVVFGCNQ